MKDNMLRPSDWPNMRPQDPVKQLFDRVFKRHPCRDVSADDSSIVIHPWTPRVDIKEEAHRFILYVDAPGVSPSDMKVYMDRGLLTIEGERQTEAQAGREPFLRVERQHGAFHRRFTLPASADPRRITVTAREGIVHIIVRKRPERPTCDTHGGRVGAGDLSDGMTTFNAPWRPA